MKCLINKTQMQMLNQIDCYIDLFSEPNLRTFSLMKLLCFLQKRILKDVADLFSFLSFFFFNVSNKENWHWSFWHLTTIKTLGIAAQFLNKFQIFYGLYLSLNSSANKLPNSLKNMIKIIYNWLELGKPTKVLAKSGGILPESYNS